MCETELYIPPGNPEEEGVLEVYDLGQFVDGMEERITQINAKVREPMHIGWFDMLWINNAPKEKWLALAQEIEPKMTAAQWSVAWQWRTVLHKDYDQAILEFVNALVGWY